MANSYYVLFISIERWNIAYRLADHSVTDDLIFAYILQQQALANYVLRVVHNRNQAAFLQLVHSSQITNVLRVQAIEVLDHLSITAIAVLTRVINSTGNETSHIAELCQYKRAEVSSLSLG